MPPVPTWFVLAIFIAAIPLAALCSNDTLKQRFKDTLDDDADGLRAVEFDGFIPDVERGGR